MFARSKFEPIKPAKRKICDVAKVVTKIREDKKINGGNNCRIYDIKKELKFKENEIFRCLEEIGPEYIVCDRCQIIIDNLFEVTKAKCAKCGNDINDDNEHYVGCSKCFCDNYYHISHKQCICSNCSSYGTKKFVLRGFCEFILATKKYKVPKDLLKFLFDLVRYDHIIISNQIHFIFFDHSLLIKLTEIYSSFLKDHCPGKLLSCEGNYVDDCLKYVPPQNVRTIHNTIHKTYERPTFFDLQLCPNCFSFIDNKGGTRKMMCEKFKNKLLPCKGNYGNDCLKYAPHQKKRSIYDRYETPTLSDLQLCTNCFSYLGNFSKIKRICNKFKDILLPCKGNYVDNCLKYVPPNTTKRGYYHDSYIPYNYMEFQICKNCWRHVKCKYVGTRNTEICDGINVELVKVEVEKVNVNENVNICDGINVKNAKANEKENVKVNKVCVKCKVADYMLDAGFNLVDVAKIIIYKNNFPAAKGALKAVYTSREIKKENFIKVLKILDEYYN